LGSGVNEGERWGEGGGLGWGEGEGEGWGEGENEGPRCAACSASTASGGDPW